VIEDNPANLDLMTYLLEAFGHTVLSARNGADGLEMARRLRPDLVICDVQMPVMDGLEVARQLKSDPTLSTIPLVAVTALAMVGDRDRLLAAGFDAYVAKPIDPEAFTRQLEGFLVSDAPHPSEAPAQLREREGAETWGPTILVVDDQADNHELARSILQPSGYRVVTAAGATAALRFVRENAVDLVLSDVCMGEGSGLDLVSAIRADPELERLAVVLITSTYTDEPARARGLAAGADAFLFRPIEPETLLREIASFVQPGRTV